MPSSSGPRSSLPPPGDGTSPMIDEPVASTKNDDPSASPSPSPVVSPRRSTTRSPSPPRQRDRSPSNLSMRSLSRSRSRSRSLTRSSPSRSISSARRSPVHGGQRQKHPSGPCVKVTGLTNMVTRAHVEEIFGHYGEIRDCSLPLYAQSHESRGLSWILFSATTSAEKAIDHMNNGQIDGAVVQVDFDRFPQREAPRDRYEGRYGERYGRPSRGSNNNNNSRMDHYVSSETRHYSRNSRDGQSSRYAPSHLSRDRGNGYGRRSFSRDRSRSPPPRKLKRHRSISRSLSRDDRSRGRREHSFSSSPSRSRSRSRSYSPPPRRRDSYSKDSRSPRRSRSPTPRRTTYLDRKVSGTVGSGKIDRSRSRSRSRSLSRSESPNRSEADERRHAMSTSPEK